MCNKEWFELCLSYKGYNFFVLVNGFHSGGNPLHHAEHNSLVRKSSTELQVKMPDFLFCSSWQCAKAWLDRQQSETGLTDYCWVEKNFLEIVGTFFHGLISKLHYKPSTKKDSSEYIFVILDVFIGLSQAPPLYTTKMSQYSTHQTPSPFYEDGGWCHLELINPAYCISYLHHN